MPTKISHRAWSRLELGVVVCVFITLTVLDIRDLNYKINWLGPYISYRFAAVGPNLMQPMNLTLTFERPPSGSLLRRPSGWSSFFEQCENMSPITNGDTFRALMGHNCKIGTRDNHVTYQQLIMASSARADSVAWACCQLLEPNRYPPVCNSDIVRGFEDRYNLDPVAVPDDWVTQAGSIEEQELLNLLDVIGTSTPLTNVMCIEGVEYLEPGQYYTTVLGCGAPNYFRSAFAGHYATKLRDIHRDLGYLTVDNINLMGFHFKIRENCVSDFKATLIAPDDNKLMVTHTTTINFSSYGQLYALMIVVDTVLMIVNLTSALQLAFNLVIPAFRSKAPQADAKFAREGYAAFLTSSLNRSPVVIALLIVSQLLSWLIIIPNAIMWTWGNSQAARIQAYLSSVRTWTLILIVVNAVWDLFVFAHEKLAFQIAQHTFLMSFEIIVVGSYVSYYNRAKMFGIAEAKYRVEKQRNVDSTSFHTFAGAGNTFNKDLDYQLNTPTQVLYIVYQPLFIILLYSVIAIFVYAVIKGIVIYSMPLLARRVLKKELFVVSDLSKFAVSSSSEREPVSESSDANKTSSLSVALQKQQQPQLDGGSDSVASASARSFGTAQQLSRFGLAENSIAENAVTVPALPAYKRLHRGYARLPLEELLNVPIRARSLVRPTFSLDHIVNSDKFVAAQLYLEFGVFFVAGRMKPRWGFLNPVPPVIQVNDTVISDLVEPLTPVQQLSRLRPATTAMAMVKK